MQPGGEVELLFVASNESPDTADKLASITSDFGTVSLSGDTELPPIGVLVVGEPDGQIAALEQAETAEAAKAMVDLSKPITNGLTYDFTFTFQKAGQTTVPVPISAGEAPRRDASGDASQKPATRAVTTKVLSAVADTVTSWPRRVRSTAVLSATTSPRNGSGAARTAAPGEPSTK